MKMAKFLVASRKLLGPERPVDGAFMVQRRKLWVVPVSIAVFVVIWMVLAAAGIGGVVAAGVAGGGLGLTMVLLTDSFFIAYGANEAYLIRAAKLSLKPRAEEVLRILPLPLPIREPRGVINLNFEFDGEKYLVSRLFKGELDVVSAPA